MKRFYVGLHQPCDAWPFLRVMVSVNRLRERKRPFRINSWIMDSGAFTELSTYGAYRESPLAYAEEINRWFECGNLQAAITQDYMCEDWILQKTVLSVKTHQQLTIERYLTIRDHTPAYVMPVLQGYRPEEYLEHIELYGSALSGNNWVGVGSVCKRNGNPDAIEDLLLAIKHHRPDLQLHGFGLKLTALERPTIRELLFSCDSMAWSFAGRREDDDANDPRQALEYAAAVEFMIGTPSFVQPQLFKWWIN